MEDKHQWPLYEVFIRPRGGLDHKHAGSVHAADARMALEPSANTKSERPSFLHCCLNDRYFDHGNTDP